MGRRRRWLRNYRYLVGYTIGSCPESFRGGKKKMRKNLMRRGRRRWEEMPEPSESQLEDRPTDIEDLAVLVADITKHNVRAAALIKELAERVLALEAQVKRHEFSGGHNYLIGG